MDKFQVISGPMFAGKSSKLIELAREYTGQGLQVVAIKPVVDNRYGVGDIVAHTGAKMSDVCIPIASVPLDVNNMENIQFLPVEFFQKKTMDVVIVDEAQFFTKKGIATLELLGRIAGCIIFAGLDLDAFGKPFGFMGDLLCKADKVTKLESICAVCQKPANRTFRKNVEDARTVVIGGAELYESRCLDHWTEGMKSHFSEQWL